MSEASEKYVRRGYAPGNYCCICKTCNGQFIGEKRSWCCLGCAKSAGRIEALEAKLANALEALEFYATQGVTYPAVGNAVTGWAGRVDNGRKARTTLDQIQENDDEQ